MVAGLNIQKTTKYHFKQGEFKFIIITMNVHFWWKSSNSGIESVTSGFLCGELPVILFSNGSDPLYCDDARKPVYPNQKPVAFMKRLVELFTTPGDWIFDKIGKLSAWAPLCLLGSTCTDYTDS